MKIIGLCGGSGSGKGFVSSVFLQKYNIPAIDTDKVYHELTSIVGPCLSALAVEFGEGIISHSGSLDRNKLFEIVFSGSDSKEKQERLNKIAHSFIKKRTLEIIEQKKKEGYKAILIDAPLLYESGFDAMCESVILVTAERETRISRITERDNISREKAMRRIDSQLSDLVLLERVDYVIDNSGRQEDTEKQIDDIIKKIII